MRLASRERQARLASGVRDSGAVETKIDESGNGNNRADGKGSAGSARGSFESAAGTFGRQMTGRFEDQKPDGGENGSAGGVQNSFQRVDTKGIGEGHFVFAGNQDRADGFGGAAEQEQSGRIRPDSWRRYSRIWPGPTWD